MPADIYMLSRVLHDWPDEDCVRILRTCRAAGKFLRCELTVRGYLVRNTKIGDQPEHARHLEPAQEQIKFLAVEVSYVSSRRASGRLTRLSLRSSRRTDGRL
jgi:hypothetical protein